MHKIRIGTRGSKLALWQAGWVKQQLRENGVEVCIVEIKTSGDVSQTEPIRGLGGTGVFTKEIQSALLENEIDVAVHSLKDLPTEVVLGLELAAVPQRGPFRDVLLCSVFQSIDDLPHGATIGTGSARRKAQLLNLYADQFKIVEIRGNVETRLKKLSVGDYDAIVLAEAGLVRLGLQKHITSYLEQPLFLPAVGQGALGLEIRSGDQSTFEAIAPLNDPKTFAAITAERTMLQALRGGCLAPIAAYTETAQGELSLHGRVLSPDGKEMVESKQIGLLSEPKKLGISVAEELLRNNAAEIIAYYNHNQ